MAALDLASFDAALKKYYTDDRVKNLVYKSRPLLAMLPKQTKIGGKSFEVPITIGAVGGRSKTFTDALTAKNPSTHRRFSMPLRRNYALADIDGLTMEASVGDRNAFFEAATSEIDAALRQVANDAAYDVYRDATGLRGTIAVGGAAGAPTYTLAIIEDIHAFEVGMTLESVLFAAGVGGAIDTSTGVVTEVDRAAGTFTVSPDPGYNDTDFIFALGDASAGATRPDKIQGLGGWLPDPATVTATLFFGVDRTEDVTRLAGVFYDAVAAGDDVEQALVNAGAALFTEGGAPTHVFMHPTRVAELDRLLEQRGRYDKVQSADAEIGFEAIVVHTGGGTVMVMGDPWCPKDLAYMLQMDTWKLCSLGTVPKIIRHDGNRLLRVANADAVEVRTGYYAQLSCNAPGWNCRILLA